jgi:uncharacterized membrane protein
MDTYTLLKTLHVISATVLLGTGGGIAFFMWMAHRSGDVRVIAAVAGWVVIADACFTAPAVVVQFISGVALARLAGFSFSAPWLAVSIGLFLFVGACWLPVVWLQWRARNFARAAVIGGTPLPEQYFRTMKLWFALGWPAFTAVLLIVYLMVKKAW